MENSRTRRSFVGQSLLGTQGISLDLSESVLALAKRFQHQAHLKKPYPPVLARKTVALLLFEPSTRTRISFEMAAKNLGGNTILLLKEGSSARKGETIFDTARNIEALCPHVLVLRHPSAGSPHQLSSVLKVPVINAGDGFHEHPTQALADLMTLKEALGDLSSRRVLIIGDIAHSRVARSNIFLLQKYGVSLAVCGPGTLIPPQIESLGVRVFHQLDVALSEHQPHGIMALRIQHERLTPGQLPSEAEYARFYGISKQKLFRKISEKTSPLLEMPLIMHPGPVNRGVELESNLVDSEDSPKSLILQQAGNGLFVRMAILSLLLREERDVVEALSELDKHPTGAK